MDTCQAGQDATLKEKILSIHGRLGAAESLRPSPHIDRLFSELVEVSISARDETARKVLGEKEIQQVIPTLRRLSAAGECELERHWAGQALQSEYPTIAMELFPYYHNYLKLTELEFRSLGLVSARPIKRVLFVGSGPLPLSSILMAQRYGLFVDNIDSDETAVRLSSKLVKRLGLCDVLNIELAQAQKFCHYDRYDAIFLASLVGDESKTKYDIINIIRDHMKPGSLLVARTAHNLRTLLYPEVDLENIDGLEPQVTIQPLNEVVNSVVILEKPYGPITGDLVLEDKFALGAFTSFQQACRDVIANVYRYPYNHAWHFDIDQAEEIYGRDRSNIFIVRHRGEVLATAAIRPYDRDYAMFAGRYDSNTGSVWRFFTDPRHQSLDLAHLLQSRIEQFARDQGFTKLYAHEQRNIPGALGKYIRNGYQVVHESDDRLGTVHFEKILE